MCLKLAGGLVQILLATFLGQARGFSPGFTQQAYVQALFEELVLLMKEKLVTQKEKKKNSLSLKGKT